MRKAIQIIWKDNETKFNVDVDFEQISWIIWSNNMQYQTKPTLVEQRPNIAIAEVIRRQKNIRKKK